MTDWCDGPPQIAAAGHRSLQMPWRPRALLLEFSAGYTLGTGPGNCNSTTIASAGLYMIPDRRSEFRTSKSEFEFAQRPGAHLINSN